MNPIRRSVANLKPGDHVEGVTLLRKQVDQRRRSETSALWRCRCDCGATLSLYSRQIAEKQYVMCEDCEKQARLAKSMGFDGRRVDWARVIDMHYEWIQQHRGVHYEPSNRQA